ALLEEAVKRVPNDAHYLTVLGAFRLSQGDAQTASADFQKAQELSPENASAARGLALSLLAVGRSREASELLKPISANAGDENLRRLEAFGNWLADDQPPAQALLRGLQLLAKGDADLAWRTLGELPELDHNPTHTEAILLATQFFYGGAANFQAQRFRQAIADWREAQRLVESHKLTLPWQKQLAAYYHNIAQQTWTSDPAQAIEAWQAALKLLPEDKVAAHNLTVVRRALAQQAWQAGQIEQAATIWQELLQLKPQDESLLQNSAIACERLGRKADAVNHWRALARLWRQQFKQLAEEAGFKQRLQSLEQRLLTLMMETGASPEELLEESEATLKFDPENHDLRLKTAELLMELGKPQRALRELEQAERQRGASAILLTHKALALDMMGREKDARKAFEQAHAMEPQNKTVQVAYLGFLGQQANEAMEDEDDELAIEICETQLRVDPIYFPAIGMLAELYFEDGRKAEAKALLTRLIEADPKRPQPYVATGAVYLKNNLKKDAEALFARAIELEPSTECFFQIGLAYAESGDAKGAVKHFDRAAETAGVEMLLQMGMELFDAGKPKDGDRYINKAKKLDPTNPMPHFVKGLSVIRNPLSLIFLKDKDRQAMNKNFAEAERLMEGRKEYDSLRQEIAKVRRMIEGGPGGLPPFLLGNDDDDDEFFFGADNDDFDDEPPLFGPPRKRATKKSKKRK
ncbi:MAG TPA: tetratricopeptide repeat protein, partial [Blastocatellia bacterium]|nr:tetratricopeptide repeat protein [Blastocatellia bacterium]